MSEVALLLLLVAAANEVGATATCQDGSVHPTLSEAIVDPACVYIHLAAQVYTEAVSIERDCTLIGAGVDQTLIACLGGPCFSVGAGARLTVQELTITSDQATIEARNGSVKLSHLVLGSRDDRGGTLVLRESDALLSDMAFLVPDPGVMAIDAVSGIGHDIWLTRVSFHGRSVPTGSGDWMYALNYGVVCKDCQLVQEKQPGQQLADRLEKRARPEVGGDSWLVARRPIPKCEAPSEGDVTVCAGQCPEGQLVDCVMRFDATSERCEPRGQCMQVSTPPDLIPARR